jgi:hypothetical protein
VRIINHHAVVDSLLPCRSSFCSNRIHVMLHFASCGFTRVSWLFGYVVSFASVLLVWCFLGTCCTCVVPRLIQHNRRISCRHCTSDGLSHHVFLHHCLLNVPRAASCIILTE